MNILFFDTETTGLPTKQPLSHPSQPKILQLGAILAADSGVEIQTLDTLVKIGSTEINKFALAAHGISAERANAEGIDPCEAFSTFYEMAIQAEALCCHNHNFDIKLIEIMSHQVKGCYDDEEEASMRMSEINDIPYECTMMATINYCALPFPSGRKGFKFPKLEELHTKLFGSSFDGAHDALADVSATMRCYFKLKELGVM